VLLLALAGQVKEQLASLALAGAIGVILWSLALLVVLLVQLARKSIVFPFVVGLAVSGIALLVAAALVLQAPLWVQWRAAPAIAALEAERAERGHYPASGSLDGDFPSTLRATLDASGHCIYRPRRGGYHLACLGVPFSKCGYDGATRRWTGWE